ncbi:MAG: exodeoxyribonuclease VII small subunit [Clostridia bacterium]|nr:exodeoxyribonuclease VII small subunit [Clostridia bacterium]
MSEEVTINKKTKSSKKDLKNNLEITENLNSQCNNSYSFEQASKELDEIISKLENGNLNLKDSVDLYEKGALLIEQCNGTLEKMSGVITIIRDKIEKSFVCKTKSDESID